MSPVCLSFSKIYPILLFCFLVEDSIYAYVGLFFFCLQYPQVSLWSIWSPFLIHILRIYIFWNNLLCFSQHLFSLIFLSISTFLCKIFHFLLLLLSERYNILSAFVCHLFWGVPFLLFLCYHLTKFYYSLWFSYLFYFTIVKHFLYLIFYYFSSSDYSIFS